MRAHSFAMIGLLSCHGCASESPPRPEDTTSAPPAAPASSAAAEAGAQPSASASTLRVQVGARVFSARLADTPAAAAFAAMLPATFAMHDVNDNEKAYDLGRSLPERASNPGTIHAGDLMLYGSSTLVLFYETFETSYRYTRLGTLDDPSGLVEALGSGDVTVTFAR